MSGEDFIYSAIADDNMNAFDLNVIASSLASTDKLVRQNKQQKEENDRLREKISSLRESALQIKNLYNTEQAKVSRAEAQLTSCISQCQQLEERCLAADSDKINAELILMERIAECDRKYEEKDRRYKAFITDLIRYFSLGDDASDASKKRELKHHLPTVDMLNLPDDVKTFLQQAPAHRTRRKKRLSRPTVMCDQESQTASPELRDGATCTEESNSPMRPDVRDFGTDAMEATQVQEDHPSVEPSVELSVEPSVEPSVVGKTFCDKGTMHTTSTITRATCTSAFIKRVDVGVNFPEVTHKSVDEILRECVPLPPLLLSPITDILPLCASVGTQTDAPVPDGSGGLEKPSVVTCGTITNLRNIRKRIDYRGADGSFQQQYSSVAEQLFAKIKQEDHAPSVGCEFKPDNSFDSIHPHLSVIWTLLGETIFMLMNGGRRFDGQCYDMLNDQLSTIRDMIEAEGRRESELMSTMFSNVRATVVAAAGYGKDRGTVPLAPATALPPREQPECPRAEVDVPDVIAGMVDGQLDRGKNAPTALLMCAPQTKEHANGNTAAPNATCVVPEADDDESIIDVASSIETNDAEAASQDCRKVEVPAEPSTPSLAMSVKALPFPAADDENDRLAQQLRLIVDGTDKPPKPSALPPARLEWEDMYVPASDQSPVVSRPSTPPSDANTSTVSYSAINTTATFVSPIKVKETNQLVKDQFKTPAQPPISKRKLRLRRSSDPPSTSILPHDRKRMRLSEPCSGRTSPTTEFLLEDDWDQKFASSIKAIMTEVRSLDKMQSSPLSPIADRMEEDEENEEESPEELPTPEVAPTSEETPTLDERHKPVETEADMPIDRIGNKDCFESPQESTESEATTAACSPIERRSSSDTGPEEVRVEEPHLSDVVIESRESTSEGTREPVTCETSPPGNEALEEGEIVEEEEETELGELVIDIDQEEEGKIGLGELVIDVDQEPDPGPERDSYVWDSPMSPPAHETGMEVSRPSEGGVPDSPLSPPLPQDCGKGPQPPKPPLQIPLHHVALHQQLQQNMQQRSEPIYRFVARYNHKRWQSIVKRNTVQNDSEDQTVMKQLSEVLAQYLRNPDWTEAVVNDTMAAVLNCTQDARLISLAVLETVITFGDITINVFCSPPAPPLPLAQQKLILIVRHLAYGLEALDEVFMRELDRRMFQLKGDTLPLPALIALTFLYIGLEDSRPSEFPWKRQYGARLYIFKCLYYFGFKCLPLVYNVLRAFPFALPKKGSPHYDNADAMIATIRTILMNMNYSENGVGSAELAIFRKRELLWLLRNHYGYQMASPTYDELVANLVEKIRANKLRNVAHSLILVAKRNGCEWARLHIIQKRIYPLLNEYLKQFEQLRTAVASPSSAGSGVGTGLDERIVTCIFTIASIMKTQPSHEDTTRVMQIFTTIVQLADGHQQIQEEAIAGLVKFSRFGFADIFQRLSGWNPDYPISDRIKRMLETMIYRKPPGFWRQLMDNRVV